MQLQSCFLKIPLSIYNTSAGLRPPNGDRQIPAYIAHSVILLTPPSLTPPATFTRGDFLLPASSVEILNSTEEESMLASDGLAQ